MVSVNEDMSGALKGSRSLVASYDKKSDSFTYHKDLIEFIDPELSEQKLWDFLGNRCIISATEAAQMKEIVLSLDEKNSVFAKPYTLNDNLHVFVSFIYFDEKVTVLFQEFGDEEISKCDELTGLLTRNDFCAKIKRLNENNPDTDYALFYLDIIKFKAINDFFGFSEGDALLSYIASKLKEYPSVIVSACRLSADHFAFLADTTKYSAEAIVSSLLAETKKYKLPFEISLNIGIYLVPKSNESGHSMLDKAMLAQSTIKGNYTKSFNFFTEKLHAEMLSEQEIYGEMNTALSERQFVIYYQPQYNHSTGMLVGAEALVRWMHPTKGMISPARFIPVFEKNGFITKLDFYVFEEAARFVKRSLDNNFSIVPISVNFSKHDIFSPDFVQRLEDIREKYGIPAKYLRIEITESILMGNNKAVNEIMSKLHLCGYIVEMDDFGSGYSSLNVLKDLDFDIIKLDMLFLEGNDRASRGGTILSSVINMAKWLNIPVIAEGVETVEQADFLRSIGCNYIQGYLYSKPLPPKDYEALVSTNHIGAIIPQMNLIENLNSANFWEPASQETLIFSNFVGAAAIFSFDKSTEKVEILRVNKKYLRELGMNLSEKDVIHANPIDTLNKENKELYISTLKHAIETGEEQECETWREIRSECCGTDHFCIRSTITVIGESENQVLFHCMIRNITSEKNSFTSMLETERRFKMASEQVNIYFWEYTIATREMRPCFRCMRDLGLPPLVRNYPDTAIEMGIFPPEVADMYRDWHIQIANGVKELEAIIPLTPDRVPFRVRYTTEFDENGHPIKAYGSAALVVD